MFMTSSEFAAYFGDSVESLWYDALDDAMYEFGIKANRDQAGFLAQAAYETNNFTRMEENLNYTAKGLLRVWPKRFTPEKAAEYAHKPELIANYVYANRMGNGDEQSCDGWTYRGRGPFHHTGLGEYQHLALRLGCGLVQRPELVALPQYGARASAYFWERKKLNGFRSLENVTRAINGGLTAQKEREIIFYHFWKV